MSVMDVAPAVKLRLNADFRSLAWTLFFLCAAGWVMMTSASSARGASHWGDSWYYSKRQLGILALGAGIAWLVGRIRVKLMRLLSLLGFFITLALLGYVLVKGQSVGGQQNWIPITSSITLQPSELAKLSLIMASAAWVKWCHKREVHLLSLIHI